MSVATPTVLPRPPLFPALMPRPQQPYPTPLAVPGRRAGRLILRRDLVQEMDDLSDEEAELDDNVRSSTPLLNAQRSPNPRPLWEADDRGEESRIRFPDPARQDVDAARREKRRTFFLPFPALCAAVSLYRGAHSLF